MQCREVRDLLDSFLGQELMVETNHELMRHLETCPDCRAELDARRQLRTVLRRAFTSTPALQPRSRFSADALARARTAQTRRTPWSQLATWGTVAASALLVASAALFVFEHRAGAIARDAVGDHRNCAIKFALAERPIPLGEAATRFDPIYSRLQDTPPDEMVTAAGPLRVVDRHSCVFAGRRFGHVVLRLDGSLVSVLLTHSAESVTPGSNAAAPAPSWLPRIGGLQVGSFAVPGHLVFIVSDLPEDQFRTVARALTPPLSSRLAILLHGIPAMIGD
jgi:hypothetical protein